MRKQILVLDDSPFMLTMLGDLLSSLNYVPTTVDNAKEALQKIQSTRYDLIITDMNMPEMDGIQFTRLVRTWPGYRFLPIVMISSEKNEENISSAKKFGVSAFLSKPLKEAQLKTMLQIILNKRMSPRIPVQLEVILGEDQNTSCTFNVSMGGAFIETDDPPSAGEVLELKLCLPDSRHPVICQARVAWVNSLHSPIRNDHPPGMGLEFLNLNNESRLEKFLQSGNWKARAEA